MTVFAELRETYRAKLAAAGALDVTTDPNANVPMVLVDAVTVTGSEGVGAWTGELAIRIVVPPPGDAAALEALQDRLELVLTTFPTPITATPGLFGPRDLPAYTVTYRVTVPKPNC